ncbi:MAG TPA: nucleotidyltransferase domain-containing protein [Phenylobacterium sp.]
MSTLFAELQQQVETAPPAGSVYRRTLEGAEYIYAKVPVGAGRVDRFIGKSGDPEAEAQAASLQAGAALAAQRRRLVAMLRREGLAAPDRIMGAVLDALAHAGLFQAGAVLVGTAAYLISEPLVGRRLPSPTLMTGDLDLATASVALTAEPPERFEAILRRADPTFEGVLQLDPQRPPSRFRNAGGYLVDLVTPTRTRDDANPVVLAELGAGAAPLQHLAWLIEGPVRTVALSGAGVLVSIPQPARFAVHKLILAQRRDASGRVKRAKDLAQAKALIEALQDSDRFALEDALADARAQGAKGWRVPISRALTEIGLADLDD